MSALLESPSQSRPATKKYWTKTNVNFWLDFFLLIVFMVLCWSAVIVRFVFPPALRTEGWTLWGLDYQTWSDVQFATLCVLSAGILLHVMLHWTWVCSVAANLMRKKDAPKAAQLDGGTRTLWGVGLLIVIFNILGVGIAVAALTIEGPGM